MSRAQCEPNASATDAAASPRPGLLLCCVLVLVAAAYAPVLGAPFIWDDVHLIRSPLVTELRPLGEYFSGSFWQHDDAQVLRHYYRPLSILSLAVDHRVFGDNPGGFHLSNLLWHLLAVALLFALLRRIGASGYAAALGSACFGLHPRLTEAAAWISGRTDVLAGCFVLGALLAQRAAFKGARWLSALLLLLGLFCKESAAAGLLALLVLEWQGAASAKERVSRLLPCAAAVLTYTALRLHAVGSGADLLALSASERGSALAEALGRYLWMLALPWFPDAQIGRLHARSGGFIALGACALILAPVLIWRARARFAGFASGALALSLGALGLALFAIPFSITALAADRFLYLPIAGAVLLATPLFARRAAAARWVAPAALLLAASFALATFPRNQAWASELEFWAATLHRHPEAPSMAEVSLGSLYFRQGEFQRALQLFQRGAQPGMDYEELARNNTANTLLRVGRYAEAAQIFGELSQTYPRVATYPVNLALAHTCLGLFPAARAELNRVLSLWPADVAARELRARLPQLEAARRALSALPASDVSPQRARLQAQVGMTQEALSTFSRVLEAPTAGPADAAEATWLALGQGDAPTIEAFFSRYKALAADQVDARLALSYDAHRDALQELDRVWPTLQ